jgi:elongation factor P
VLKAVEDSRAGGPTLQGLARRRTNLEEKTISTIAATQLKRGMVIMFEGNLTRIVETIHKTPGNLRGFVQAKMRDLKTGSIFEHRFRSVDMAERAYLEDTPMEYLFSEGDMHTFMNNETFEQIALSDEVLGDAVKYLIPNLKLKIEIHEGNAVGIELPLVVEMKVMETEPTIKGASVSNQSKPAKMETGLMVNVPPFISEGDVIRIDTTEGKYIERAK